jgi:hypothetical protein
MPISQITTHQVFFNAMANKAIKSDAKKQRALWQR